MTNKYYIDCDERYPDYDICKVTGNESQWHKKTFPYVKIPSDKLRWIKKTFNEYEKVQEYLRKLAGDS